MRRAAGLKLIIVPRGHLKSSFFRERNEFLGLSSHSVNGFSHKRGILIPDKACNIKMAFAAVS